jgi:hypothetical protein
MNALFIVLNDLTHYDDVMEIFYELRVGATTMDTTGMRSTLERHRETVPFIGHFDRIFKEGQPYNKTIFSVIYDDDLLHTITSRLEDEVFDYFQEDGKAFMFVMPVAKVYGCKNNKAACS